MGASKPHSFIPCAFSPASLSTAHMESHPAPCGLSPGPDCHFPSGQICPLGLLGPCSRWVIWFPSSRWVISPRCSHDTCVYFPRCMCHVANSCPFVSTREQGPHLSFFFSQREPQHLRGLLGVEKCWSRRNPIPSIPELKRWISPTYSNFNPLCKKYM